MDVRITPRASRNRIEGAPGAWKVYVTAAPVDGGANEAVRELLAKKLRVAKSSLTLVKGETSREKRFRIEGLSLDEANERLATGLNSDS